MLNLPPAVRIYLCTTPTDMRRSFDGLATMVREQLGDDPLSGHLFVFFNKRKDRLKVLYWDSDGLALWCKRLERGCFSIPPSVVEDGKLQISFSTLQLLLSGVDWKSVRFGKRYSPPQAAYSTGV